MDFLADESCDFSVVRALRKAGHTVVAVAQAKPGAADKDVLGMTVTSRCILLTEDKDFGQWVYAAKRATGGVILLQYPATARAGVADAVVRLVEGQGDGLVGCFAVVEPGRVRIRRPPGR